MRLGATPERHYEHDITEADEHAIRDLVALAQESQSDPEALMALHTAETSIVNLAGRRVLGREAYARATTTPGDELLRAASFAGLFAPEVNHASHGEPNVRATFGPRVGHETCLPDNEPTGRRRTYHHPYRPPSNRQMVSGRTVVGETSSIAVSGGR